MTTVQGVYRFSLGTELSPHPLPERPTVACHLNVLAFKFNFIYSASKHAGPITYFTNKLIRGRTLTFTVKSDSE